MMRGAREAEGGRTVEMAAAARVAARVLAAVVDLAATELTVARDQVGDEMEARARKAETGAVDHSAVRAVRAVAAAVEKADMMVARVARVARAAMAEVWVVVALMVAALAVAAEVELMAKEEVKGAAQAEAEVGAPREGSAVVMVAVLDEAAGKMAVGMKAAGKMAAVVAMAAIAVAVMAGPVRHWWTCQNHFSRR